MILHYIGGPCDGEREDCRVRPGEDHYRWLLLCDEQGQETGEAYVYERVNDLMVLTHVPKNG